MVTTILRLPDVLCANGDSRSTHYSKIDRGLWTPPVAIGARSVGWPDYEVTALNNARIAGKSDEQIRTLVVELIAARELVG